MTQTTPSHPDTQNWWEHQAQGPIVHPSQLRDDPLRAMGAALFHIGMAGVQYSLIAGEAGRETNSPTSPEQRFTWAEADARQAHQILHHVSESGIAYRHELGPEIRKAARIANLILTQERQAAATALGITPPPRASDYVQSNELDRLPGELDDRQEPQPSPQEEQEFRLIIDESAGYPIALLVCLQCERPLVDTAQGDTWTTASPVCDHSNTVPLPEYMGTDHGPDLQHNPNTQEMKA